MIKAIALYTFLLRTGDKRLVVKRGVCYPVTAEELKAFKNKFILHEEYARTSKSKE